jgi:hypothetical protein
VAPHLTVVTPNPNVGGRVLTIEDLREHRAFVRTANRSTIWGTTLSAQLGPLPPGRRAPPRRRGGDLAWRRRPVIINSLSWLAVGPFDSAHCVPGAAQGEQAGAERAFARAVRRKTTAR